MSIVDTSLFSLEKLKSRKFFSAWSVSLMYDDKVSSSSFILHTDISDTCYSDSWDMPSIFPLCQIIFIGYAICPMCVCLSNNSS